MENKKIEGVSANACKYSLYLPIEFCDLYEISISGRIFQLDWGVLSNIPYLYDILIKTQKRSIFIQRSPKVFEEVLAYAIDSKHSFPKKYIYELEFYGMKYQPNNSDISTTSMAKLQNELKEIKQQLDVIENICYNDITYNINADYECASCKRSRIFRSHFCSSCSKNIGKCIYKIDDKYLCGVETKHNFCEEHIDKYTTCIKQDCIFRRMKNSQFCFIHKSVEKLDLSSK